MPGWYAELLTDYLRALARRGRSPNTLASWRWALSDFGRSIPGVGSARQLERRQLHAWQDAIGRRLAPHSQGVASTALRGFLRWIEDEREDAGIRPGLWTRVAAVKTPAGLPRPIPHEDLRRLLDWFARPTGDLAALRDRALFMFLLTSGARISEALQVTRDQVAADRMVVRQKGGSEKLLIISPRARTWVSQYLRARGADASPWLWVSVGPRPRRRLSADAVQASWTRTAARLGVQRWTHHQLRHTCATELLSQGATELDVAEQLGHRGLATVQRYAAVTAARRRELVGRLDELVSEPPARRPAILKPLSRRRRRRGHLP